MGFLGDLWDGAKNVVSDGWDTIKGGGEFLYDNTLGALGEGFESVYDWAAEGWDGLSSSAQNYLKGLTGGAAQFAADQYSSAQAYERSKEAADEAYRKQTEFYRARYQNTAKDMREAGLNPILAATGGFQIGNAPAVNMAQAPMAHAAPDVASSARSFAEISKVPVEINRMEQDIQESQSRISLNSQRIDESMSAALKNRSEAGLADAKEKETVQNIINLKKDVEVKSKQISKMQQEIRTLEFQGLRDWYSAQVLKQEYKKVQVETQNIQEMTKQLMFINSQLQKKSDVYNTAAGSLITWVKEIREALGFSTVIVPGKFAGPGK